MSDFKKTTREISNETEYNFKLLMYLPVLAMLLGIVVSIIQLILIFIQEVN